MDILGQKVHENGIHVRKLRPPAQHAKQHDVKLKDENHENRALFIKGMRTLRLLMQQQPGMPVAPGRRGEVKIFGREPHARATPQPK